MARQRLDTKQAAEALGITPDAVRKRASRGQLESDKDPGGKLYIWLDTDAPQSGHDDRERLIEFLYEQLEREREANRENRRLLAAALERIPSIEPPPDTPPEPPESAETASEEKYDPITPYVRRARSEAPAQDPQPEPRESPTAASYAPGPVGPNLEEESSHRSWWRKLFGG